MDSTSQLKSDFLKFLRYVFLEVFDLPEPSPCQYDIAKFLTSATPNNKKFVQAFRGVGKSYITCVYVVWRLWRNPYLKVIIASADQEGATLNASLIRQIIHHPAGDELWAGLRPLPDQVNNVLKFDVGACADKPSKERSVRALSIGGTLAGNRGDLMILDDVENTNNSQTESARDTLRGKVPEFINMLRPGPEAGIVVLGTPQSMDSIYKDFGGKGYTIRIWTQRYPLASKIANYGGNLAPRLLRQIATDPTLQEASDSQHGGAVVEPRFLSLAREQEIENGAGGYLLQFMLDTELSDQDRYPLKARDLICTDVDPFVAPVRQMWATRPDEEIKDLTPPGFRGDRYFRPYPSDVPFEAFTGAVMAIDPSGKGKDETAYVVTKFLNGYIYVRRWGGFPGNGYAPETLTALAEIAKAEKVGRIIIEANMGSGMFTELLKPHLLKIYPVTTEDVTVSTQKEHRIIDTLAPLMASHKLVMDIGVIRADAKADLPRQGMYQLCRITAQRGSLKYDDRLDVLASGVSYWTKHLAVDEDRAEEARKEREWQELRRQLGRDLHRTTAPPPISQQRAPGRKVA